MSEKVMIPLSDVEKLKKISAGGVQPASLEMLPDVADTAAKNITNAERRRDLASEEEIEHKNYGTFSKNVPFPTTSSGRMTPPLSPSSQAAEATEGGDWERYVNPDLRSKVARIIASLKTNPWIRVDKADHVYINDDYVAPLSVLLFALYGDFDGYSKHIENFRNLAEHSDYVDTKRKLFPLKMKRSHTEEDADTKAKKSIVGHAKVQDFQDEFKHLDKYFNTK